ncbi:SMI1/KNR4 family protein [Embleya sp. NBC_00896]|uniref:SMI1/KNR4 family protein n=1 Tax=Embleya sp. NBC_00896 TaxID=2975961 RepID=UPI003867B924|nr:SMI1/KNR4 family protein [Embleya sp. NBC_00896]
MAIDDWTAFLRTWSDEWVAARTDDHYDPVPGDWLGFEAAAEEEIAAAERRLGLRFPPSYRAFLAASNGWRHAGSVDEMCSTRTVGFFRDMSDFVCEMLDEYEQQELAEDTDPDDPAGDDAERIHAAGKWKRAVQVSLEGDLTWFVLDPGDVGPDGEWAAYRYASWWGDIPKRHESFADLMYSMFQSFHQQMQPDNATSRDQDAKILRAQADLLDGRLDRARAALEVATGFGRPRAGLGIFQIRVLFGENYMLPDVAALLPPDDPFLERCALPVLAAFAERGSYHGKPDQALEPYREQIRNGTFTAWHGPGIEKARELVLWGDLDAAWHVLTTEALPEWRPVGNSHLAPIELLADPYLAPLITPERARLLLTTPRPGRPAAVLDEPPARDGITWLQQPQLGFSYCITFTRDLGPRQLAERLGVDPSAVTPPPCTSRTAAMSLFHDREEDQVRVGECGNGWSFAIENNTDRLERGEPPFPGVTLWVTGGHIKTGRCAYVDDTGTTVCELTVTASNGYDHDGSFQRSGTCPDLLDAALTDTEALDSKGRFTDIQDYTHQYTFGYNTLQAVERHFGLTLPRDTIQHGRIPVFHIPRHRTGSRDGLQAIIEIQPDGWSTPHRSTTIDLDGHDPR